VIHAFQKLDICVERLRHNPGLFEEAAIDQFGAAVEVIENPHNQTPERSRPVGAIGIIVLYAMSLVHLLLFRGDSLDRTDGRGAEYFHLAVQFSPIRFQ
jgi:hypothetical protein